MSKSTTKKRVVKDPRLSVNKLAEYLDANPSRRKRILYQAKNPDSYIVTRFDDPREAIVNYLTDSISRADITNKIKELKDYAVVAEKAKEAWQQQKFSNGALTLEAFLKLSMPSLKGIRVEPYTTTGKHLIIKGVTISVAPDLVLYKPVKEIEHVGAVKFNLTKTTPLSAEAQQYVGVVLYKFTDKYLGGIEDFTSARLCFSVDVMKGSYQACPASMTKRWERIQDACEEIAARWDSL